MASIDGCELSTAFSLSGEHGENLSERSCLIPRIAVTLVGYIHTVRVGQCDRKQIFVGLLWVGVGFEGEGSTSSLLICPPVDERKHADG